MARRLVVAFAFALLPGAASAQEGQKPPVRSITPVAGNLYRVQNNNHYTVFYVTPAGIVLADPINADFAAWLKGELAQRFPNAPGRALGYG
ncbi:MAG: hypothetical protein HYY76_20080 [Acidobacteria bacterium]|nr:hypothetical protein [Acidobacteriota bacterium]